jgi:hypothetical protein
MPEPQLPPGGPALGFADIMPMLQLANQVPQLFGTQPGVESMAVLEAIRKGENPEGLAQLTQASGRPQLSQEQLAGIQRPHNVNPTPTLLGQMLVSLGYEADKGLGQAVGLPGGVLGGQLPGLKGEEGLTSKASFANAALQNIGQMQRHLLPQPGDAPDLSDPTKQPGTIDRLGNWLTDLMRQRFNSGFSRSEPGARTGIRG